MGCGLVLAIRCCGDFPSLDLGLIRVLRSRSSRPSCGTSRYNDFDINFAHLSSLASTNAVAAVSCRAVYTTLINASCCLSHFRLSKLGPTSGPGLAIPARDLKHAARWRAAAVQRPPGDPDGRRSVHGISAWVGVQLAARHVRLQRRRSPARRRERGGRPSFRPRHDHRRRDQGLLIRA